MFSGHCKNPLQFRCICRSRGLMRSDFPPVWGQSTISHQQPLMEATKQVLKIIYIYNLVFFSFWLFQFLIWNRTFYSKFLLNQKGGILHFFRLNFWMAYFLVYLSVYAMNFFWWIVKNMMCLKFIYSEMATKILRNLHLFLTDTSTSQKKVEILQKFYGLFRKYEIYLQ